MSFSYLFVIFFSVLDGAALKSIPFFQRKAMYIFLNCSLKGFMEIWHFPSINFQTAVFFALSMIFERRVFTLSLALSISHDWFFHNELMVKGFYLHHSGLWCIHQFRIPYFSSANLKTLSFYQRYQRTSHTCEVYDELVRNCRK